MIRGDRYLQWRLLAVALLLSNGAACDSFEEAPTPPANASARATALRDNTRKSLTAVLEASKALTASCVADTLIWEADPSGYVVPRHYSRPCLPERCDPDAAHLAAFKKYTAALKAEVATNVALQTPSFQGYVAIAEALAAFVDTALAAPKPSDGPAPKRPPKNARWAADSLMEKDPVKRNISPLSGLSMHYTALASAYRDVYPDADVPLEPPSLVKSLAVAQPGGDPCKGWALPRYCDVSGVKVPAKRRWRTDPACIEVLGIPK